MKKYKCWDDVVERVNVMNEKKLIILYNLHNDFLFDPAKNNDNDVRSYKSFRELICDRLIRQTWKNDYHILRAFVDLVLVGYDYNEVVQIVFQGDHPSPRSLDSN